MSAKLPEFEDLSDMAHELMDSWDELSGRSDLPVLLAHRTVPQVAVTLGLASHAHVVGRAALPIFEADNALAAVSLVRVMYECALTAQWVAQVDGACNAFLAAQTKQRRNLLKSMQSLSLPSIGTAELDEALALLDSEQDTRVTFESICAALRPGGPQAYAHYRLMSQLSHPSDYLLDHYFGSSETSPGIARKVPPTRLSRDAWLGLALASLVWAGQAVEYSTRGRPRRALLRKVAERLNIDPVLRPSR